MVTESEKTTIINKIISKFPKKNRGDLFQECYLTLEKLIKKYDNNNKSKATFSTYSYKRLYFCCVDFLAENRLNNYSLDDYTSNDEGEVTRKIDLISDDNNLETTIINQDKVEKYQKKLTKIERKIQQLYYYEGYNKKEILNDFQHIHKIKSPKTIKKILTKK